MRIDSLPMRVKVQDVLLPSFESDLVLVDLEEGLGYVKYPHKDVYSVKEPKIK